MSELYKRIENLCIEHNTNITEMCRDLKIPRSPFSELKAGRSKSISADRLAIIANHFNVSVDFLLGKDDSVRAFDEQGEPLFIDDEVREFVDALRTRPEMKILFSASRKASKEDIMKAVKIIEALRDESND